MAAGPIGFAAALVDLMLASGNTAAQPLTPFMPGDGVTRPRDREPRVSIELLSIYANIETGWEPFGSDEIIVAA